MLAFFNKFFKKSTVSGPNEQVNSDNEMFHVSDAFTFNSKNSILCWGIDWQASIDSFKNPLKRLSFHKSASHYYYSTYLNCGGLTNLPAEFNNRNVFSAALLFIEQLSNSPLEIFIFKVGKDCFSLVALDKQKPVPGFDGVFNQQELLNKVNLFQSIHVNNVIRFVGDIDFLPNIEKTSLEKLDPELFKSTILKRSPTVFFPILIIMLCIVSIAAAYYSYIYYQKFQALRNQPTAPAVLDPNEVYDKIIVSQLSDIQLHGSVLLSAWLQTLETLPSFINGWSLTKINCDKSLCSVRWERSYGNYADWHESIATSSSLERTDPTPDSKITSSFLVSHHRVITDSGAYLSPLLVDSLPSQDEVKLEWASNLQDIDLLSNAAIAFYPASLFGSDMSIAVLNRPVVKGSWAVEAPLWMLPDLLLPYYVKPDSLQLSLTNHITANIKLTGSYYAKGKLF